ncbi:hypothetical protein V2O64_00720 [Verrucomicrobiaceae bacterium 227]
MKGKPKPDQAERASMASTKADLRELKANSSATVSELQEFLRQLRGKGPQEMLGVVASSQLFRATILSLILVTGALFALTAIPYFFGEEPTPVPVVEAPAEVPTQAPPVPEPNPIDPQNAPDLAPLGINDELPAPPNTNPLEDKGGNFLDDLE